MKYDLFLLNQCGLTVELMLVAWCDMGGREATTRLGRAGRATGMADLGRPPTSGPGAVASRAVEPSAVTLSGLVPFLSLCRASRCTGLCFPSFPRITASRPKERPGNTKAFTIHQVSTSISTLIRYYSSTTIAASSLKYVYTPLQSRS